MGKASYKASIALFASTPGTSMALAIGKLLRVPLGKVRLERFSDGELRAQLLDDVVGKDVFIVGPTHAPTDNLLELAFMADAARGGGAKCVTLIIPYLSYNRQDKHKPGKPLSSRVVMDLLARSGASRVIVVDIHAEHTLEHFGGLEVLHLSAAPLAAAYVKKTLKKPFAVASPDRGGIARAQALATLLGASDVVFFEKSRHEHGAVKSMTTATPEKITGKHVLFVDDMIDSGGTLVQAAAVAKKAGAKTVSAFASHAVLSGNALKNLQSALSGLILTDTIPHVALRSKQARVTVLPLAPLFAQTIIDLMSSRPSKARAKSPQKSRRTR
ncbi:MAG TPA: ribose-phosphate pyrophosphokinase [Candidatus Paceibacterota bacterium]|nr:ribose-phosphate pyrophosphokinase [Candidatus Paceibacterota bacterium]